ncbi:MAG: chemotaxis protein CheR, partial [Deltaproteobacteria bacterium]|nr:chemotaxis protein CheR [Deltaproteobacteria bacterium]
REPKQFDYLAQTALGETICNEKRALRKSLLVWSAGCSTGEEPYTLAMVVANFMDGKQNGNYSILATDISTRVLGVAKEATYAEAEVAPVPLTLKKKYLMRGKGPRKGFARIVPSLRKRVSFQRLNLNKGNHFGIRTPMDIIFCRNVIIYFDRQTQTKLFEKFYAQLAPGGYMF